MFKDKPLSTHGVQGPSPKTELGTVDESTLPNEHINAPHMRSVMWHGPSPTGLGSRSEVPDAAYARGVTGGVETPTGATLADAQSTPAAAGVRHTPQPIVTVTRSNGDVVEAKSINASKTITGWDECIEQLRRTPWLLNFGEGSLTDAPTATEIEQGEAIVRISRAIVTLSKADRKRRKDTEPQPQTLADYQKKGRQIDRELTFLQTDEPEPLMYVMGVHAVRVQSFTAIRSALKWRALNQVIELLKSQDAMQRASGKGRDWLRCVAELYKAVHGYIEFKSLNRQDCLDFMGLVAKNGRSKKSDLPFLPDGWEQRFREATIGHPKYDDVGVLLLHCGLRPVELATGVLVSATSEGIEIRIEGGKVRETAGQPWRTFTLDPKALPPSFVQRVRDQGTMVVSAEPDSLRLYLGRLSDQVFLQGRFKQKGAHERRYVLSAYTFRHALVTSLREEGWETETIAAVIGEVSAETVRLYGIRRRGGAKADLRSAVIKGSQKTARPVRGLDMQGLEQVKDSIAQKSTRSSPV